MGLSASSAKGLFSVKQMVQKAMQKRRTFKINTACMAVKRSLHKAYSCAINWNKDVRVFSPGPSPQVKMERAIDIFSWSEINSQADLWRALRGREQGGEDNYNNVRVKLDVFRPETERDKTEGELFTPLWNNDNCVTLKKILYLQKSDCQAFLSQIFFHLVTAVVL